jgi:arylsulfatase A-like enzyme
MMNRRRFLANVGASVCATSLPAYAGANSSKPNILIIITDQQSAEAASYRIGGRYIHTPNMDSVAARGTVFTRAYCANPLCVPSRTSMFTGQYPTATSVMDNSDAIDLTLTLTNYPRMFPMMGRVFQQAGYETAYFGKWHIPCPVNRSDIHGFRVAKMGIGEFGSKSIDAVTAADAAAYLQQEHGTPFLAVASFLNPHNIAEWSRGQALPLGDIGPPPPLEELPPLRANHAPQKDEPDTITLMRRSYQSAPMFPVGEFDDTKWRQYQWAYYRLIEKVDAQIGIVLQALRASGHVQDTLVVMMADHGDCQGAHRWNQKTVFYEEATRVPFVLTLPGATKPGQSLRLVNTGIDLMPTLCDFAGIAAPPNLPGLSVRDAASDPRRYIVVSDEMLEGAPLNGRKPDPTGRMLRSQRYKYCVYSEGERRESLVDLERDPGEMVNLAGDFSYCEILGRHRTMLAEWCRETHDAFCIPE